MARHPLRRLPSVDRILKTPKAVELSETYGRIPVVHAARAVLQALRAEILESKGDSPATESGMESVVLQRMEHHLERALQPSLRRAINATGVILHTGLGRAVLPEDAEKAVSDVIRGSCTLAIDQETGRRGHRDTHLEKRLCELTGAEAATVVNNNAAATMLILNTLARGKEVIVSRGQLVEIGGSFRMPDVMAASGAILKEVGTTNKTHLEDYEEALSENTGAILRVHHSNYRILGFAEEPSIE
ncbi:MAG: L-seryl-tRNA(Sec) selenium transferase, partial [Candidatus Aminicenantales bacterium]